MHRDNSQLWGKQRMNHTHVVYSIMVQAPATYHLEGWTIHVEARQQKGVEQGFQTPIWEGFKGATQPWIQVNRLRYKAGYRRQQRVSNQQTNCREPLRRQQLQKWVPKDGQQRKVVLPKGNAPAWKEKERGIKDAQVPKEHQQRNMPTKPGRGRGHICNCAHR